MRLFLDLNVVLDVLARRDPWFEHSSAVLSLVENRGAEGHVAAHTITTLHYLLSKHIGRGPAAAAIVDLLALVTVDEVGQETLTRALALGWGDLEDAVQAICALRIGADYLVTRDPRGFADLSLAVVSPSELVALLSA